MSFEVHYSNKSKSIEKKIRLADLIKEEDPLREYKAAKVNNVVRELSYEVYYPCNIEFLTLSDPDAVKIYEATLRYVVAMAFRNVFPTYKIRFAYNVSRAVSIYVIEPKRVILDTRDLLDIQKEIDRIITCDYPLERLIIPNEKAKDIYIENGYFDKVDMLAYRPEKTVHLYRCNGYLNYMYNRLLPSTGYLKDYKLRLYSPGFMLQYPRAEAGGKIPEFEDAPTYGRVLQDTHSWGKIIGAGTVCGINKQIEKLGTIEFINLCEAKHNRMLCELGEMIERDIDSIKLICVAGPSSSGKTTFANRLRIELLSRGIQPIRISLDDYYLPREQCPKDENGNYDFESIEALDIELFNQHMLDLISGKEVLLPRFDFEAKKRIFDRKTKLGEHQPLIIEGIHALNERMTVSIPKSAKFKIFISPQIQLNLDDHNPVSLTDLRLIRRMVRDKQFRNSPAEETLSMWPSVRKGEFKWVYGTQEGCDYVYNSMLPYELPALKKYALPLLDGIDKDSEYFPTALRLKRMLKFFVSMDDTWIPSNSLIREFIGGSCYKDV